MVAGSSCTEFCFVVNMSGSGCYVLLSVCVRKLQ